jgi:hypothetical protein
VTIEMHNVFNNWGASTASRDMVGSLWTCPTHIDICAVGWLQCRLCFYHEIGAGNKERIHFTSTHFATEAVTRLYSPTTFTYRIFRFFHYKKLFQSLPLLPTYMPLQEKNYSRQGFFFSNMSFRASTPTSSYGRSVSPINYNTFVKGDPRSTSNMNNSKVNMPSPTLTSAFIRDDPTPSPTHRPVVNRHLGFTSYKGNLKAKVDPKVNVSQVNPATSSRKRPLPRAPASVQKKVKLGPPAAQGSPQESNQNSTKNWSKTSALKLNQNWTKNSSKNVRKDTPDSDGPLVKNTRLHGGYESDELPEAVDDFLSEPEDSDFDFDIEFINSDSNLKESNIKSNPATSSRKHPLPRAFDSTQKKVKLAGSAPQELPQKSDVNSTPAVREETPDFEEFLERENLMLHGVEEDDVSPDSDDDYFDFGIGFINSNSDLKKSNVKSNPENNTNKSNLENKKVKSNINAGITLNDSKPKPKPKPNPSTKDNLDKGNVATLRYSQLKKLSSLPPTIVYYGPDGLLTTTTKANFRRMVLDQLHAINRDNVPKKFHPILDQVIKEKTVAFQDELDDVAYDLYFPDHEDRMENYRIFEYMGDRTIEIPSHRLR